MITLGSVVPVSRGGTGLSNITANKLLMGMDQSSVNAVPDLHWDAENKRLGVNTVTPQQALDINGSINVSGTIFQNGVPLSSASVADGSITTAKLQDGSVTSAKLASNISIATLTASNLNVTGALFQNGTLFTGGSGGESGSTNPNVTLSVQADTSNFIFGSNNSVYPVDVRDNLSRLPIVYNNRDHGSGWFASLNASANDNATGCTIDVSGNVYYCGVYNGSSPTFTSASASNTTLPTVTNDGGYLVKLNSSGALLWRVVFDSTSGNETVTTVRTDSSGFVYCSVTGRGDLTVTHTGTAFTMTMPSAAICSYVFKLDGAGVVQWWTAIQPTTTTGASTSANSVNVDASGNVAFCGTYITTTTATGCSIVSGVTGSGTTHATLSLKSLGTNKSAAFLLDIDPTGTLLWVRSVETSTASTAVLGERTVIDSQGNIYLYVTKASATAIVYDGTTQTGPTLTATTSTSPVLIKFNGVNGGVMWFSYLNASTQSKARGLAVDSSGNVYTGTTSVSIPITYTIVNSNGINSSGVTIAAAGSNHQTQIVCWDSSGIAQRAFTPLLAGFSSDASADLQVHNDSRTLIGVGVYGGNNVAFQNYNLGANPGYQFLILTRWNLNDGTALYSIIGNIAGTLAGNGVAIHPSLQDIYVAGSYNAAFSFIRINASGSTTLSSVVSPSSQAAMFVKFSPTTVTATYTLTSAASNGMVKTLHNTNSLTVNIALSNGTVPLTPGSANTFAYSSNQWVPIGLANITSNSILDSNIIQGKLGPNSVLTTNIVDSNVTTNKLADGAVTVAKGGTGLTTLTSNKLLVGNGTGAITLPTALHFDTANNRLGIGNTAPTQVLDVSGSINFTGSLLQNGSNFVPTATRATYTINTQYRTPRPLWGVSLSNAVLSDVSTYNNSIFTAIDISGFVYVTAICNASGTFVNASGTVVNLGFQAAATNSAVVAKVSASGTPVWAAVVEGVTARRITSVATDTSGFVYIAGYITGNATFYDANTTTANASMAITNSGTYSFVAKLTPNGVFLWRATCTNFSTLAQRSTPGASVAVRDNIVCFGSVYVTSGTFTDTASTATSFRTASSEAVFMIRLDTNGVYQWHVTADSNYVSSTQTDYFSSVAIDSSGSAFMGGLYGNFGQIFDTVSPNVNVRGLRPTGGTIWSFIIKYNSSGVYQWHVTLGDGSHSPQLMSLGTDSSNTVTAISYFTSGSSTGSTLNAFYDSSGNLISRPASNLFGTNTRDAFFVVKFGSSGDFLWRAQVWDSITGFTNFGTPRGTVDSAGNVFVATQTNATNIGVLQGGFTTAITVIPGWRNSVSTSSAVGLTFSSTGQCLNAVTIDTTAADSGHSIICDPTSRTAASFYLAVIAQATGTNVVYDGSGNVTTIPIHRTGMSLIRYGQYDATLDLQQLTSSDTGRLNVYTNTDIDAFTVNLRNSNNTSNLSQLPVQGSGSLSLVWDGGAWNPMRQDLTYTAGTLAVSRGGTGVNSLTIDKLLVGSGSNAVRTPTDLHWNNTLSRLGISTTNPITTLDVNGDMNFSGALQRGGTRWNVALSVDRSDELVISASNVSVLNAANGSTYTLVSSSAVFNQDGQMKLLVNQSASTVTINITDATNTTTLRTVTIAAGATVRLVWIAPTWCDA